MWLDVAHDPAGYMSVIGTSRTHASESTGIWCPRRGEHRLRSVSGSYELPVRLLQLSLAAGPRGVAIRVCEPYARFPAMLRKILGQRWKSGPQTQVTTASLNSQLRPHFQARYLLSNVTRLSCGQNAADGHLPRVHEQVVRTRESWWLLDTRTWEAPVLGVSDAAGTAAGVPRHGACV